MAADDRQPRVLVEAHVLVGVTEPGEGHPDQDLALARAVDRQVADFPLAAGRGQYSRLRLDHAWMLPSSSVSRSRGRAWSVVGEEADGGTVLAALVGFPSFGPRASGHHASLLRLTESKRVGDRSRPSSCGRRRSGSAVTRAARRFSRSAGPDEVRLKFRAARCTVAGQPWTSSSRSDRGKADRAGRGSASSDAQDREQDQNDRGDGEDAVCDDNRDGEVPLGRNS